MGLYVSHTVGSDSDLGLRPFIGLEALDGLLRDLPSTAEKQAAVDEAIKGAESIVNSYLADRYELPITPPPRSLVRATGILAVEDLYGRGVSTPTQVTERADTVRSWLADVANETASLDHGTEEADIEDADNMILSSTEDRVMTRDDLSGW
jgi:phage gp36-like protein